MFFIKSFYNIKIKKFLFHAVCVFTILIILANFYQSVSAEEDVVAIHMTGEVLTKNCRAYLMLIRNQNRAGSQIAYDAAHCRGFIIGVVDVINFEKITASRDHLPAVCLPRPFDIDIVTEIVSNYADRNPAKRTISAYAMARKALAEVYPCR